MTYSERTRELAAQLCSMAACMRFPSLWHAVNFTGIPFRTKAFRLAWDAAVHVRNQLGLHAENHHAEAEALIRTGWEP